MRHSPSHPHDPADLRRCELLLRRAPLARMAFDTMRGESPEWSALVEDWQDLVEIMEEEVPGVFDTDGAWGAAPRTYGVMRWLIDNARAVA